MAQVKLTDMLEKIDKLEKLTDGLVHIIQKYPKDEKTKDFLKEFGLSIELIQQSYGELEILKTKLKNELDEVKIESIYF